MIFEIPKKLTTEEEDIILRDMIISCSSNFSQVSDIPTELSQEEVYNYIKKNLEDYDI